MEWRVKAAKDGGRRGGSEVGEGKGREVTGRARGVHSGDPGDPYPGGFHRWCELDVVGEERGGGDGNG